MAILLVSLSLYVPPNVLKLEMRKKMLFIAVFIYHPVICSIIIFWNHDRFEYVQVHALSGQNVLE